MHYHSTIEVGYCYKGSGIFIVDNKILPFAQGSVSIIFPNELHIAKSNPEDTSSWHFINLDPTALILDLDSKYLSILINGINENIEFEHIISGEKNKGLILIVQEMLHEISEGGDCHLQAIKGLAICLFAKLVRMIPKSQITPTTERHNSLLKVSLGLNYIYQNYNKYISIKSLASICDMSVTNFRRTFLKAMGSTPLQYIHQFKIRMASSMLTGTNLSVLEISIRSGYESLSSFNRFFKKIVKMSPKQWRQQ